MDVFPGGRTVQLRARKSFMEKNKNFIFAKYLNDGFFKTVIFLVLKVGGNEKQWGSRRSQMLGNGLGPWRSRFIYNLNTQLLNKNHISFSALSRKMNKRLL